MPYKNVSAHGSAAALAVILFFAGEGAAQAARCPLGEIYRPSRGICVSKEEAVQIGIYRPAARQLPVSTVTIVEMSGKVARPAPRARAQALAAIERRAPAARPSFEGALAFVNERNERMALPDSIPGRLEPSSSGAVVGIFPAPSPFGSLVPLELVR